MAKETDIMVVISIYSCDNYDSSNRYFACGNSRNKFCINLNCGNL